jgi:arginine/lysine/ornithine decarboxylase
MVTPENSYEDLQKLVEALGENHLGEPHDKLLETVKGKQEISVRRAMFSHQEKISVEDAKDRICASPMVGCPPAIPIVVSGEVITGEAIQLFQYYGIKEVYVVS